MICRKCICTVQLWEVPMRSDHIYCTFMGGSFAIRSDIQYIYGKFFCDQIIDTVHVCKVHMRSDHIYSTCKFTNIYIKADKSLIQHACGRMLFRYES